MKYEQEFTKQQWIDFNDATLVKEINRVKGDSQSEKWQNRRKINKMFAEVEYDYFDDAELLGHIEKLINSFDIWREGGDLVNVLYTRNECWFEKNNTLDNFYWEKAQEIDKWINN